MNDNIIIKNSSTLPILNKIKKSLQNFPFQESHYISKYDYGVLLKNMRGLGDKDYIQYGDYKIRCRP